MNLAEVKEKAKKVGINVKKMKKAEIIQAIQAKENNIPCFGTATDYCDQEECLWRKDCLGLK
ncbi:Hypothetical protein LUCI_1945 [Lucifera butyrica]|uniref:SAP domain-containing protein n=1 Tax=Lucifera butyrica TaxID=1351585 RepID=A0A498R6A0_9FIRM|nr:SAP domain-containing protein [Lucifera butyrica]VBB06709.1 Hypothetical protein LUCI_1945 [Lucifera butyrica]